MQLSNRMKALKKRLFDIEYHNPGVWHFQNTNILDAWPEIKSEPIVVRKGYAQKYIGERLPVKINPDELIVGIPNQNSVGWGSVIPKYYTEDEGIQAARCNLNECSVWGHHPPEWGKVIRIGVLGIKEEILDKLEQELRSQDPDQITIDNYRAMLVSLDGIVAISRRYAEHALSLAKEEKDLQRRDELLQIYRNCQNVPVNPARSFHEATQSFWFMYTMVNSGGEFVPLGRADQTLYPYYERDLISGVISEEEGRDILASFLVKCNERIVQDTKKAENHYNFGLFSQGSVPKVEDLKSGANQTGGYESRALTWQENESDDSDANYNYGQSGNDWLMNCMVGGVKPDGTDGTNAIAYMFVEIMNAMDLIMPTLGARVHKDTPKDFIELLAKVLRYGRGEPMIYCDESIIPGFVDLGVPLEDARDYSNDGCWETLIQGKSHFSYAHVMNLRCLEWVFNRGVSQHNNLAEGLDTGELSEFTSFETFYEAYKKQMYHNIDMQCKRRLENFQLSYMIAPDPLLSSIMSDCIVNGRDISQDGARYIFHMILVTGLSCAVDSLMAIKQLVFDEKKVAIEELHKALQSNWKGFESLRSQIIHEVPKFGNDIDEVDDLALKMLKDFENRVTEWNRKGKSKIMFTCGIGTFENYAVLGRDIAASVDGRRFGDPIAPNYSPTPGMDKEGPTATIRSITKPDLLRYFSGTPLDLSINSHDVEGDAGIIRLAGVIRAFCDLGGQILTITSTNIEDLKDAKIHPERHRGLMVRMGGLSAYYIAMSPVQQDNIIKRFSR